MPTGWLNVYWRGDRYHAGGLYPTQAEADRIAKSYRLAAVEVILPPLPIEVKTKSVGKAVKRKGTRK